MLDLNAILAAIAAKAWVLLVALVVFAVVGAAKQGWLSAWLARKLPAKLLPYLAMTLSFLGTVASAIIAGQRLSAAFGAGFAALPWATLLHEVVVEGWLGGREPIPEKKLAVANDNGAKKAA
jgi:hypothetical protein